MDWKEMKDRREVDKEGERSEWERWVGESFTKGLEPKEKREREGQQAK